MRYMLLIYADETRIEMAPQAQQEQLMTSFGAYTEALRAAGALLGGDRLHRATAATTVRTVDGQSKVLDGPYAESKEELGGYYVIEAPDLDAAVSWAARCPGVAWGAIEVRPIY